MWIYHRGNERGHVLRFLFNAWRCFRSAQEFGHVGFPAAPSPAAALSAVTPAVRIRDKLMLSSAVSLQINSHSDVCWQVPLRCPGTNTQCPVGWFAL